MTVYWKCQSSHYLHTDYPVGWTPPLVASALYVNCLSSGNSRSIASSVGSFASNGEGGQSVPLHMSTAKPTNKWQTYRSVTS